jgi:hypothetical protein
MPWSASLLIPKIEIHSMLIVNIGRTVNAVVVSWQLVATTWLLRHRPPRRSRLARTGQRTHSLGRINYATGKLL